MSRRLLPVLLTLLTATAALPARSETYTCYCENSCGNGGIGADAGKVLTGQSQSRLRDWFGLDGPGESRQTGWTCVVETTYDCACERGCGNGGVGGYRGQVRRGVSAESAMKLFGAWRTGSRSTGWSCVAADPSAPPSSPSPGRPATEPPGLAELEGTWRDSNGMRIHLRQSGTRLRATMDSSAGEKWWTSGEGRISGRDIEMSHYKGSARVDLQRGRLVSADRIEWGNRTHWERESDARGGRDRHGRRGGRDEPDPRAAADLTGEWVDSGGMSIRVAQEGSRVLATMESSAGRKWWTTGEGEIRGDRVEMTHRRGGTRVDRQSGRLAGGDRIEWGNGSHWERALVSLDPVVEPEPRRVTVDVSCSSKNKQRRSCPVPGRILSVTLTQQHSRSGCDQGRDWGWDGSELWVDNGCRADFRVEHDGTGSTASSSNDRSNASDGELLLGALLGAAGLEIGDGSGSAAEPVESEPSEPAVDAPEPGSSDGRDDDVVDLAGDWEDAYSSKLTIEQSGDALRARMRSRDGQRWWTHAEGRIDGSRVTLTLSKDGVFAERLTGFLVEDGRIEWGDGRRWRRTGRR